MDMLSLEFRRLGMLEEVIKWPVIRICTVEQTEWYKGYRLSLTALYEELFGEPFPDAHRARVDVQALTRVFLELRKREEI
jgi:DNA polymerase-3 subunit alpha